MVDVADNLQGERAKAARAAANAVRREGSELCVRLVFRASRNELRRVGITTPAALYDELKQVFWNADEGVTLGDHFSVGFGKVDRRRQVRAFAERHAGEPRSVIAKAYECEYGFSAGVVAIWLDEYAGPSDVHMSEWLGIKTPAAVGAANEMDKADGSDGARAADDADDDASVIIDVPEANDSTETGDGDGHGATSINSFFSRELDGDICDAELVRRRFAFEFPSEGDDALSRGVARAGYYENRGLLFREGGTPNERFTRLIATHPTFAKGDAGFEDAVWKHPTFRYVLHHALEDHRVLLYEGDSYISFARLHDELGARMSDIDSFVRSVSGAVPEDEPFTIASLRASDRDEHPLFKLDMPDDFYEGLLDTGGLLRSCTVAGTKVFVSGGEDPLTAVGLIEWLVLHHEGIEREDLPRLLKDKLGISCPAPLLTTTIHTSSVYYDDIGNAYYSSMEEWKKGVRNELA